MEITMAQIIQSYILCLITTLSCKILLDCFFNTRKKNYFFNLVVILFYNVFIVAMSINCKNYFLKFCCIVVLYSIIYCVIYDAAVYKVVIASTAYCALSICIETPFYIIFPYIVGPDRLKIISDSYFLLTIVGLIVESFDLLFVLIISRIFGKKGYLKFLNIKDWFSFLCLPIISAFLLLVLVYSDVQYFSVCISVFLLLFNVFFYSYLQENGLYNKRKQELLVLEERNRSELQSFKDIGSLYDEQRLRIHEFKNQINFINGLIDKQDYDTLRTYVGKIKSDIDSEEKLIETGNSVINILINQSIRKASQKHIYITPNINIMQDIQLEDNDLVIIISNLINNAIEHCDTLKKSNKIINFKLESTDDHLLIVCTNPIETTIIVENNLIRTTKNNYAEHGFGLKNINRMVDKYDGDISISTDDNKFKYVIMIQYKEN